MFPNPDVLQLKNTLKCHFESVFARIKKILLWNHIACKEHAL